MSLIWLCRECRPALFRQASPWRPSARTRASQTHRCGWTNAAPSRRPAATRTDSLSSLRPTDCSGSASSQSPNPSALDASKRARSDSPVACSSGSSATDLQHRSFQARWKKAMSENSSDSGRCQISNKCHHYSTSNSQSPHQTGRESCFHMLSFTSMLLLLLLDSWCRAIMSTVISKNIAH